MFDDDIYDTISLDKITGRKLKFSPCKLAAIRSYLFNWKSALMHQ